MNKICLNQINRMNSQLVLQPSHSVQIANICAVITPFQMHQDTPPFPSTPPPPLSPSPASPSCPLWQGAISLSNQIHQIQY